MKARKGGVESFFILMLFFSFLLSSYGKYHENLRLSDNSFKVKSQLREIKSRYPSAIFIPSIGFPLGTMPNGLFLGNLFDEEGFIHYNVNTGIAPAGWLSRHPFFYDFYSPYGYDHTSKKFNFYNVITSKDTYFVGYGERVSYQFIDYYNNQAPDGWHHIINLTRYGDLTLAQIQLVED